MKKLLSALALLLTGCVTCQQIALLPEERAWLGSYTEGQRVVFRSNRGTTATATVLKPQEWHTNTDCNWMESGKFQPIFSQIVLRPSSVYNDKNRDFVVNLRKNNPERPADVSFSVAGLECLSAAKEGQITSKLQQQACTLSTTGKTYLAAYVFRQGRNATIYGGGQLQAFFWDKQDGLIRYELTTGEVFELVSR